DISGLRIFRRNPRRIEVGAGDGCEQSENERHSRYDEMLEHVGSSPGAECGLQRSVETENTAGSGLVPRGFAFFTTCAGSRGRPPRPPARAMRSMRPIARPGRAWVEALAR